MVISNLVKPLRRWVKPYRFICILVITFSSLTYVVSASVGEGGSNSESKPFYTKSDLIIDSFVIKPNTIIRTSDSLNAGAKYLSEAEMSSSQQCLLWCWDNRNCTLAVYEEKSKGSCYLFDCGPPDQMRCKFTGHDHYTSSLIKFNRNTVDGNTIDQRNQAKHENDLVNLRSTSFPLNRPIANNNSNGVDVTSTSSVNLIPPPAPGSSSGYTSTPTSENVCKRHQFQCRNSTDCIAIYNVCDGIIQCSDGSDEAIDLHCPSDTNYPSIESQVAIPPSSPGTLNRQIPSSSSSSPAPRSTINYPNSPNKNEKNDLRESDGPNGITLEGGGRSFGPKKPMNGEDFNYPKSPDLVNDLKENGKLSMGSRNRINEFSPIREKFESKSYYPNYGSQYYPSSQQPQPPPPPPSHGGDFYSGPRSRGFDADYSNSFPPRDVNYWQPENGMIGPGSNVRPANNLDHSLINPMYHQYRPNNDMVTMNVNNNANVNEGNIPQSQPSSLIRSVPWSKNSYLGPYPRKPNDFSSLEAAPRVEILESQGPMIMEGSSLNDGLLNNNQNLPVPGGGLRIPSEEQQITSARKPKNSQSAADNDLKEHAKKVETLSRSVPMEVTTKASVSANIKINPSKLVSHLNSDKISNNWAMPVAVTHLSNSQSGRDTNSAVIALVLGLGITAMLITLVGCRMKYIKKRIARRGRNLAHDADYLVNGMYL